MSQLATTVKTDISTFSLADPAEWTQYIQHRPQYPLSMFEKWLSYHGNDQPLEAVHDLGTGGGIGAKAFLTALQQLRGSWRAHACTTCTTTPPTSRASDPIVVKTMYLSEPGAANLEAARRNLLQVQPTTTMTAGCGSSSSSSSDDTTTTTTTLSRFSAAQGRRTTGTNFKFHLGPAEQPNPDIPPGSLDLVMACECLHFMDIAPVMRNVATSLRSGGTFASVVYLAVPRVVPPPPSSSSGGNYWEENDMHHKHVHDAVRQVRAAQLELERAWRRETARKGIDFPTSKRLQAAMGLDFVPLDEALWEKDSVVRWYCNIDDDDDDDDIINVDVPDVDKNHHHLLLLLQSHNNRQSQEKKKKEEEKKEKEKWPLTELAIGISAEDRERHRPRRWAKDGTDGETKEVVVDREGWGMKGITVDKMRAMYAARQPGAFDDFAETAEWKALVEAMEGCGGTVDAVVPAMMLLARRK